MKKLTILIIATVALSISGMCATYYIDKDTYIDEHSPTNSFAADDKLMVKGGEVGRDVYSLVGWDELPDVEEATLFLCYAYTDPEYGDLQLYSIQEDWYEDVTWNNQPSVEWMRELDWPEPDWYEINITEAVNDPGCYGVELRIEGYTVPMWAEFSSSDAHPDWSPYIIYNVTAIESTSLGELKATYK